MSLFSSCFPSSSCFFLVDLAFLFVIRVDFVSVRLLLFQSLPPASIDNNFLFPHRFRTYFPDAYRTHYPNARAHLPPSLAGAASHPPIASSTNLPTSSAASKPNRSTHPDGTPLFPLPSYAHPKQRPFSAEEDSALLAGFRKHGAAWAAIVKDAPVFGVTGRRSMDLRDRFRNA